MSMARRSVALLVCAIVGAGALAGCRSTGSTATSGENCEIKIGVLEPLSGTAAGLGLPVMDGVKLAVDQANSTGSAKGCKVSLESQDYKSDTSTAATRVQRLISDGVYGIVGPNQGSATLAISPMIKRAKVPVCAFNNTISITNGQNPYIFRCQSDDSDNVRAAVLFAKQQYHAAKVVVLHTDDAYGTDAANALKSVAKSGSTAINVADDISFSYTATDITSEWSRAKAADPDAYILWGSGSSMAVALRDAQQLGIDKPIIGSQGLASQAIVDAAGSAADGVYAVGLIDPSTTTPAQETVAKLLKQEKGANYQPTLYNYIGWDSVQLLLMAHAKNPDDAKAGLEQLGSKALTAGTYDFSPQNHNGLGLNSIWITQIKNGKFVGVRNNLLTGAPK